MGFRTGILIGVLATAVLALGIAVVVLLADDSGDGGSEETRATTTADLSPAIRDDGGVACRFEEYGGPVEIELNSSSLTCVEARRVLTEYRVALENDDQVTGVGRDTVVGDAWLCEEFPNADYPLMATCSQGSASFDLVGRAQSVHAPQPVDEEPQNGGPVIFRSPTGNIACSISVESLRCDILKTRYKPGPRPSGCEPTAVWGHSFLLTEEGVKSICTNDAVMDFTKPESYPTLGYGKEINRGPYFCFMEKTGLACGTPNEHYLFISYQRVTGI